MSQTGEERGSPTTGGATAEEASTDALAAHLAADEIVVFRLAGTGVLAFEGEDGTEELSATSGGRPKAVVTDRRVYFVVESADDAEVDEVPYRNVREVTAHDGLLRSRLVVRVWDRGTYRLKTHRHEPVAEAGEFVERATRVWQRVLAAVENAREEITALGKRVENGDEAGAAEARRAARQELATAARRVKDGPVELQDALAERITDVQTELRRTRVRAHVKCGTELADEAATLTAEQAWDEAEAVLHDARDHLTTAREVARAADFRSADAIEAEIDRLEERAAGLAEQPRAAGDEARSTARAAEKPEEAVPAWASALDHYRTALRFDWGGRVGVERDTGALRARVEEAAANLIASRQDLAAKLVEIADDAREADPSAAADRLEVACSQLAAAESLAREYRAGDAEAVAADLADVRERLASLPVEHAPTRVAPDGDVAAGPPLDPAGDA